MTELSSNINIEHPSTRAARCHVFSPFVQAKFTLLILDLFWVLNHVPLQFYAGAAEEHAARTASGSLNPTTSALRSAAADSASRTTAHAAPSARWASGSAGRDDSLLPANASNASEQPASKSPGGISPASLSPAASLGASASGGEYVKASSSVGAEQDSLQKQWQHRQQNEQVAAAGTTGAAAKAAAVPPPKKVPAYIRKAKPSQAAAPQAAASAAGPSAPTPGLLSGLLQRHRQQQEGGVGPSKSMDGWRDPWEAEGVPPAHDDWQHSAESTQGVWGVPSVSTCLLRRMLRAFCVLCNGVAISAWRLVQLIDLL